MLLDSLYVSTRLSDSLKSDSRAILVYVIPGNPGLIDYYTDFIQDLVHALNSTPEKLQCIVSGQSLHGFEINQKNRQALTAPPYNLQEQVSNVQTQLSAAVSRTRKEFELQRDTPIDGKLPVVLIGHSVGAYILLEIIARRQRAQKAGNSSPEDSEYEIVGGINLFPTVVDIAKSRSGRLAAPLLFLPAFALLIHWLVKLLCIIIPYSVLESIVRLVTGMPEGSAKTTTAFIQSQYGVYQSLYMAQYELLEIAADNWDGTLWGENHSVSQSSDKVSSDVTIDKPKLYFYWGENDHWVDSRTRNSLVATRARQLDNPGDQTKPLMEIDTLGIPHAFCIRHSKPVAEKVAEYIQKILDSRR